LMRFLELPELGGHETTASAAAAAAAAAAAVDAWPLRCRVGYSVC